MISLFGIFIRCVWNFTWHSRWFLLPDRKYNIKIHTLKYIWQLWQIQILLQLACCYCFVSVYLATAAVAAAAAVMQSVLLSSDVVRDICCRYYNADKCRFVDSKKWWCASVERVFLRRGITVMYFTLYHAFSL